MIMQTRLRSLTAALCGLIVLLSVTMATAGGAQSKTVSTLDQLYAALAAAKGGETILLAEGEYGAFTLLTKSGFNYAYPSTVTIASANPKRPAVFTSIDVRKAKNLTFDGILFDYRFQPGTPVHVKPFIISNGENITIRNSVFDGDVARGVSPKEDGLGYGIGLVMRASRGSRVENNEIFGFHRGMTMGAGFDAVIRGNDIHSLRSDGMDFAQMQGVLIEGNYIHDFVRSTLKSDHADMIQFWTNGTKLPSINITIRGNVLMAGKGNSTQTIFMRNDQVDRGLKGPEMFYRNVVIEDNVIVNGHAHGITLGEATGVRIRNNTLVRGQAFAQGDNRARKVRMPRIKVAGASTDVEIIRNIGPTFPNSQKGWVIADNMVIQDLSASGASAYGAVFVDAMTGAPDQLESFVYRAGSIPDVKSIGAPLLRPQSQARSQFATGPYAGD